MWGKIAALMGLALLAAMAASPAEALSSHDCSVKYKNAQDANVVGDLKYADFRKAYCGSDATVDSPMPTAASTSSASPSRSAPASTSPSSSDDIGTSAEPNITNTKHSAEPSVPTTVTPPGVPFPCRVDPPTTWTRRWRSYTDPDARGTRDRYREWVRKREAPELRGYLSLAEPDVLDDDKPETAEVSG